LSEVTVVEASKCPKCGTQGVLSKTEHTKDDAGAPCDVAVYLCDNEGCTWYKTGWVVQSDERGKVYQRDQGERGQDKTFEKPTPDFFARGRRIVEDVIREDAEGQRNSNQG